MGFLCKMKLLMAVQKTNGSARPR